MRVTEQRSQSARSCRAHSEPEDLADCELADDSDSDGNFAAKESIQMRSWSSRNSGTELRGPTRCSRSGSASGTGEEQLAGSELVVVALLRRLI